MFSLRILRQHRDIIVVPKDKCIIEQRFNREGAYCALNLADGRFIPVDSQRVPVDADGRFLCRNECRGSSVVRDASSGRDLPIRAQRAPLSLSLPRAVVIQRALGAATAPTTRPLAKYIVFVSHTSFYRRPSCRNNRDRRDGITNVEICTTINAEYFF